MRSVDNRHAATMVRVHSLAVAALMAPTADLSPGADIPPAAWERVPASMRRSLARTLACIDEHAAIAPRGSSMRSVPAPRG
jgi:hypothetical protein